MVDKSVVLNEDGVRMFIEDMKNVGKEQEARDFIRLFEAVDKFTTDRVLSDLDDVLVGLPADEKMIQSFKDMFLVHIALNLLLNSTYDEERLKVAFNELLSTKSRGARDG